MSLNDLDLDKTTGVAENEYEAPSEFYRPLEPGVYTFVRTADVADDDFGKTRMGDLQAKLTLKVQGGERDGETHYEMIFTSEGAYRKASSADDYIRACGGTLTGRRVRDYIDAIRAFPGPFRAVIGRWQGYCSGCGETVVGKRGQPRFPTDDDGQLVHITDCPKCGQKIGAQARTSRFVIEETTAVN